MIRFTSMRLWIGVSLAWPLFWALVFDRWFFFTPLGLLVAFGLPVAAWLAWWKFYEGNGEKLLAEGRLAMAKGTIAAMRLKKQLAEKRASNQR